MTTIISLEQQVKINEMTLKKQPLKKQPLKKQRTKKQKITNDEFRILHMNEYEEINNVNYSVAQLKEICSFYKLKKSGNKNELIDKIYNHLKYSTYAIKIQKIVRGTFMRKYILLAGPALKLKNRKLCVNDTDFATLEPLNEIPYNQFFSFADSDGTIYGCDIASLFEILCKKSKYDIRVKKAPLNPYNRRNIEPYLLTNFSLYLCLAKINRIEHITTVEEEVIDPSKQLEMKILDLFQYINELGNYADSSWFSNLSRHMTVLFIREVYDIWHYRAQLTQETMRSIVPPHGNPFTGMNLQLAQTQPDEFVRKQAVKIIEYLVKSGHTTDNRSLGAYYVLAALTLVSEEARNALPWLFQSVSH
jgi:hypothetical protein